MPIVNKSKSNRVLHPFLFAAFPLLALYASNIDQTSLRSVLIAVALVLFITFALFFILRSFLKSSAKAGLVVSIILLAFFSYGHIHSLVNDFLVRYLTYRAVFGKLNWAQKIDIYLHFPLLAGSIISVTTLIYIIVKSRRVAGSVELAKLLNGVAASLILISFIRIGWYEFHAEDSLSPGTTASPVALKNLKYKPDIYYIILDGYAREDVLQRYYGYDNSPFIGFLKNKGFQVLEESSCNYAYTFLSLPSSLNFQYLNTLAEKMGDDSTDLRIPYEMIKDNRLVWLLKKQGYRFVHFNSTWGATQSNNYADVQIGYKRGLFTDEYLRILSQTTMLKVFDSLIIEDLAATHLYTFETISKAPSLKGSKFVFAHMVLPHHPFIFDREGNIKKDATMADQFRDNGWANKDEYLDQLIFVNSKLQGVITSILSKSKNPPLIIIQSDHGPMIPRTSKQNLISARMSIFMACYLPGGGDSLLYSTMTPVNVFRLVLSHYFGADLPLLKDIIYFSEFNKPYKFLFVFESDLDTPSGALGANKIFHPVTSRGSN